jgi:hypothetical protein
VAGIAIRRQRDLGDVPGDVAGLATDIAVCAGQRVTRLRIVIEAPPCPAIRVVAERAAWPQATFMMLVAVAGRANDRRVLEQQRAMAFLARYDGVTPDQRKPGDIVIEGGYASPAGLTVTLLAPIAEPACVRILLAVTRLASRRQLVAIEIARVASVALDLRMRGSQRKFRRPVMIKVDRAPLALVVAALAFSAVSPGVDILNLVAIHASGAEVPVPFAGVTCGAGNRPMGALEREFRPIMVKRLDAEPRRLAMTFVACFPQTPFVRILGLVTIEAATGGVAEPYGLRVAAAARHCDMGVAKLEARDRVIEGLAVQLDDVGISALVIRMTMVAFLLRRLRIAPMKCPMGLPIGGNCFVAGYAKPRLRPWRKRLVTVAALLLELGMSGHERSGHDELLEQVLRSHRRCYDTGHTDPDHERS